MERIHAIVTGRVQGVGFRQFTYQTALEHNIKGWVRNLQDGSVEIEAQGDEQSLSDFFRAIHKGPSFFAKVKNVQKTKIHKLEDFKKFKIIY
ncbi:acylphosphatase [Gracilibacillus halophilus YIM-C55.5]|uniref:Acylphosphatase n=1 Tax=Gracilibacillus halophilus YIM-C55.5 TaxID=1308866 RepID=N4WAE5_9BACI|nr:acylphosphatase [Gracilibacillus halophilus]ENH97283.1 acylphosphatase [Gracilibacillus halophilus YIM-C55.5]